MEVNVCRRGALPSPPTESACPATKTKKKYASRVIDSILRGQYVRSRNEAKAQLCGTIIAGLYLICHLLI
jgi:hypothetical protein